MHITPATFLTCVMCIIYLVIYSFPLHAHSITWCPQANLTRDWVRQLYVVHRQCISRVALPSRANVAAAADSNSFSVMQRGSELQSPVSSRRLDRPLSTRKPTTDGKRINPDRHSAVSCICGEARVETYLAYLQVLFVLVGNGRARAWLRSAST